MKAQRAGAGIVWLNGELVDEASAVVSVNDRGFLLGDGLFETVRVYDGRAFALEAHLDRLRRCAARIRLPLPDGLEDAVAETVAASGLSDAAVRLTISRGSGGNGLLAPDPSAPTVTITIRPYEPVADWYERGLRATIAGGRVDENRATAGLKHLGYLEAILELDHARAAGCDDALFLDTAGHLVEATASNLFVVLDGVVMTPPLSCGVLPGITRAIVLRLAAARGDPVREEPILTDMLARASEAFLTSSLREIVPLVRVDGRPVGSGCPGPLTQRILSDYLELVRRAERGAGRQSGRA